MSKHIMAVLVIIMSLGSGGAALAAAGPGTIPMDYEAGEDITATTSADCIVVNGSNVTINLRGHSMICNASFCGDAIQVNAGISNTLIKNGVIKNGTGSWNTGINNTVSGGVANTTRVNQISVYNATFGVKNPWQVEGSVFRTPACCLIGLDGNTPANGQLMNNYCHATGPSGAGIQVLGGTTAANAMTIRRNYVRATNTAFAISGGGFVTLNQNILLGSIGATSNVSATTNICDDPFGLCPEPDSNFSIDVDFDVQPMGM